MDKNKRNSLSEEEIKSLRSAENYNGGTTLLLASYMFRKQSGEQDEERLRAGLPPLSGDEADQLAKSCFKEAAAITTKLRAISEGEGLSQEEAIDKLSELLNTLSMDCLTDEELQEAHSKTPEEIAAIRQEAAKIREQLPERIIGGRKPSQITPILPSEDKTGGKNAQLINEVNTKQPKSSYVNLYVKTTRGISRVCVGRDIWDANPHQILEDLYNEEGTIAIYAEEPKRRGRKPKPAAAAPSLIPFNEGVISGKHLQRTFKTSETLYSNIVGKRQGNLFDTLLPALRESNIPARYVNKGTGKPVTLSVMQLKVTEALSQILDTRLQDEEAQKSIAALTYENIKARAEEQAYKAKQGVYSRAIRGVKTSISTNLRELTKLVLSRARVGGKDIKAVEDALCALGEINQTFIFKGSGREVLKITSPLIYLGPQYDISKDGKKLEEGIEIIFEDAFLYEINDRYCISPLTSLYLWNKYGNETQLFTMLYFLLRQVRGFYVQHAREAEGRLRKELKKKALSQEDIEKRIAKAKRQALTYTESFASICERLKDDIYYQTKNGKQYLRRDRAKKDLSAAQEAFKAMGMITDYYEQNSTGGELLCCFVFNEHWIAEAEAEMRGIPAEPEERKQLTNK